jgi:hypothetical protein
MTFTLLALILAAEPMTAPPLLPAESTVQRSVSPARLSYFGSVPEGYHLVETANSVPITIGLVVFVMAYVPWAVIGSMQGNSQNAIPIFGPLISYRAATGWFSGLVNGLALTAITTDVLAQVAGAITFIVGLATPRRWLESNPAGPSISFVPGAAGAPAGASVVGRF